MYNIYPTAWDDICQEADLDINYSPAPALFAKVVELYIRRLTERGFASLLRNRWCTRYIVSSTMPFEGTPYCDVLFDGTRNRNCAVVQALIHPYTHVHQ